jgi:hypothetical protein
MTKPITPECLAEIEGGINPMDDTWDTQVIERLCAALRLAWAEQTRLRVVIQAEADHLHREGMVGAARSLERTLND